MDSKSIWLWKVSNNEQTQTNTLFEYLAFLLTKVAFNHTVSITISIITLNEYNMNTDEEHLGKETKGSVKTNNESLVDHGMNIRPNP